MCVGGSKYKTRGNDQDYLVENGARRAGCRYIRCCEGGGIGKKELRCGIKEWYTGGSGGKRHPSARWYHPSCFFIMLQSSHRRRLHSLRNLSGWEALTDGEKR